VGTAEVVLASPWQSLTLGTLFTYTGDDSALPEGELLTTDWVSVTVDTASPPWQASLAVPGVTDLAGEPASIDAEIGYGYQALQPGVDADWWWLPATWVQDDGPGDRWEATLTLSQLGTYNVTFRFTDDGGLQWQYVDGDPATPLDWMEMGTIDVNP
jgi:hypothetical protein